MINQSIYEKIRRIIPIATIDLCIYNKDEFLLLKRNNEPAKNLWYVPGGRILHKESFEAAVKRILRKETGLTSNRIKKIDIINQYWNEFHYISIVYRVEVNSKDVIMDNQHSKYKWYKKLPNNINKYVKIMINKSASF